MGGLGEQALGAASAQAKKVGEAARQKKDDMIDQVDQRIGSGDQQTGDMNAQQDASLGQRV